MTTSLWSTSIFFYGFSLSLRFTGTSQDREKVLDVPKVVSGHHSPVSSTLASRALRLCNKKEQS